MALVAAVCTQCGASIEVDDTKEAGTCRSCGTAYVTQKIINNYNTYVTQNITKIISGKESEEFGEYIKSGAALLSLGEYAKAIEVLTKAVQMNPADYRAWVGLATADIALHNYNRYKQYAGNALKFAPAEKKSEVAGLFTTIEWCIVNGVLIKCFALDTNGSVTIPSSITAIGDHAFRNHTGLTKITIPEQVTSIGVWAFINCSALTEITLSPSVKVLGHQAFVGCANLKNVYFKGTKKEWKLIKKEFSYIDDSAKIQFKA